VVSAYRKAPRRGVARPTGAGPRDASSSIVGGFTTIPPVGLTDFIRNLVSPRDPLDRVATYVLREHERGRQLQEILDDPYVTNRTNVEQRARLLDNPDLVRAIGEDVVEQTRASLLG
jgi:hypothetical protein